MRLMDAAISVLQEAKTPLHYKKIARMAVKKGFVRRGPNLDRSMSATLHTHKGDDSAFQTTGRGMFELNPGYKPPHKDAPSLKASHHVHADDGDALDTRAIGTAGEYRVMSELLLRGYGADKATIDDGIDIKAGKPGSHHFDIQVKTATRRTGDRYTVTIKKKPFSNNDRPYMYYVFVLRNTDNTLDFVMMSSKDLKKMIKRENVTENKAGYSAIFTKKGDGIFLGSRDVSSYRNDWDF